MRASIIIRTYNESKFLPQLLERLRQSCMHSNDAELIVVDSGSTDGTVDIATRFGACVIAIAKEEFSFGRSLNLGCRAARGKYLVFISGHCIPERTDWLEQLLAPFTINGVAYSYGRQQGDSRSRFSECQLFRKYFPPESKIPQDGFFCNNANAAIPSAIWRMHPFDEGLTGLEDMELAQRLVRSGHFVAYTAAASVVHLHEESWHKVRMRYEREAIALQRIMPHIHVGFFDFMRYLASAVALDLVEAWKCGLLLRKAREIAMFRFMQYWGTFRGNREHRRLSQRAKEAYFYPR